LGFLGLCHAARPKLEQNVRRGRSDTMLKFQINAQLNTLPSEDNLKRWGIISVHRYCAILNPVTGKPCGRHNPTGHHVLNGCTAALEQGRYTFRHDSVLLVLKQHLIRRISDFNQQNPRVVVKPKALTFVREGGAAYQNIVRAQAPARLAEALSATHDWIIRFDLGDDKYSYDRFPMNIADVPDRPDILLWSETRRELLAIELTCPGEDGIQAAHQRKQKKYAHLADEGLKHQPPWSLRVWAIEVGSLGFLAKSGYELLRAINFTKSELAAIKRQLEDISRRCSYFIFSSRHKVTWTNRPLLTPFGPPSSTSGPTTSPQKATS
jgi:hypothetical protein